MSSSGAVVNFGLQGGDQTDGNCCGILLSELMMMNHHHHPHGVAQKKVLEEEDDKLMSYNSVAAAAAATTTNPSNPITITTPAEAVFLPSTATSTTAVSVPSIINHILGTYQNHYKSY